MGPRIGPTLTLNSVREAPKARAVRPFVRLRGARSIGARSRWRCVMSNDLIRVLLAIVVLAHGIGHVLFAPQVQSAMRVPATGNSWLLTGTLGKGLTDLIATAVALTLVVAFSVAAYGVFTQTAGWRPLLVAASAVSIA